MVKIASLADIANQLWVFNKNYGGWVKDCDGCGGCDGCDGYDGYDCCDCCGSCNCSFNSVNLRR
ncbi:MAG: hypothetical protein ACLFPE_15205, partial [Bacteroidales bacterium]